MPNIKSAKKRVKVIETKAMQNKMFRSQLKTEIKKIDQAVAHNILHKNTAAHKKSKITKKLNAMA